MTAASPQISRQQRKPVDVEPAFYTAAEVAKMLRLAQVTVYESGREHPIRFGVIRFGRAVRFRRAAIDRIVDGEE